MLQHTHFLSTIWCWYDKDLMTLRKVKALQSTSRRQAGSTLTPVSVAFIINCLESPLKQFFFSQYIYARSSWDFYTWGRGHVFIKRPVNPCDWLNWLSPIIIFIDFNIFHLQASPGARVSSSFFYSWCFFSGGLPFALYSVKLRALVQLSLWVDVLWE